MHVFLIIPRMAAAAGIIFIVAIVVVDTVDIESSRDLAQRALDLKFSLGCPICHRGGSHWSQLGRVSGTWGGGGRGESRVTKRRKISHRPRVMRKNKATKTVAEDVRKRKEAVEH